MRQKKNDQLNGRLLLFADARCTVKWPFLENLKNGINQEANGRRIATCSSLAHGHLIASRAQEDSNKLPEISF